MTGFWKTHQIVTMGVYHLIGPTNGYPCALHIQCHYQVLLTGLLFKPGVPAQAWFLKVVSVRMSVCVFVCLT